MSQAITVLDAAMGKALKMDGVEIPSTIWSANALLVAPEKVQEVHEANIRAGARMITTNTYGVIRSDLRKVDIEDQFVTLNLQAAELARAAVKKTKHSVLVAASLPPLNGSYRPDRVLPLKQLRSLYDEHAQILASSVDLFLCETLSHSIEVIAAAEAACNTGLPTVVSFTLCDDEPGVLRSGEPIDQVVRQLAHLELAGISVNCTLPERVSDAMPELSKHKFPYIGGYANAFTKIPLDWLLDGDKPTDKTLEVRDDLPPERYVHFVEQWLDQGATLVGGCCGTLHTHTKAIAELVSARQTANQAQVDHQ